MATRVEIHLGLDDAHLHAERFVDRRHPLGIAAGEVIIDRGEMGPLAGKGIEHQRQCGDKCLAFAGLHFDDRAVDESHAGEQLHVVVPHAEASAAGFAGGGKGIDDQAVGRLPGLGSVGERATESLEGDIVECFHLVGEGINLFDDLPRRGIDCRPRSGPEPL